MGQETSTPSRRSSSKGSTESKRRRKQRRSNGLLSVLDGGSCDGTASEPRSGAWPPAATSAAAARAYAHNQRDRGPHYRTVGLPAGPVDCVPNARAPLLQVTYLTLALMEETAWRQFQWGLYEQQQQRQLHQASHAAANQTEKNSPNDPATGKGSSPIITCADGSGVPLPPPIHAPTQTPSALGFTSPAALDAAVRRGERRWWVMLTEVRLATQRPALVQLAALQQGLIDSTASKNSNISSNTNGNSGGYRSRSPRPNGKGAVADSRAPLAGANSPATTRPTTTATKDTFDRRLLAWADFPEGRSTGIVYFYPMRGSDSDTTDGEHRNTNINGNSGNADGHSNSTTNKATTATAAAVRGGDDSAGAALMTDLTALGWRDGPPPAGLGELPVGAAYFELLRRAWSVGPVAAVDGIEDGSNLLGVITGAALGGGGLLSSANIRSSGGNATAATTSGGGLPPMTAVERDADGERRQQQQIQRTLSGGGSGRRDSTTTTSSTTTVVTTAAAAAPTPTPTATTTVHAPSPLLAVLSAPTPQPSRQAPMPGKELLDASTATVSAILSPPVPLSRMIAALAPQWVTEGLYYQAGMPRPDLDALLLEEQGGGQSRDGTSDEEEEE